MTGALLATDPALVAAASPEEQARAHAILWDILPVSDRADGLLNDARLAGNPAPMALDTIRVPTLAISLEDDRFDTIAAARGYIAAHDQRDHLRHVADRRPPLDRPRSRTSRSEIRFVGPLRREARRAHV